MGCKGWWIQGARRVTNGGRNMPSTSGNMGAKHFQEFGPIFLTCPQLVGTWVRHISGILSKEYAYPLARVYAIFLFAIEYSAKAQHTTTTTTTTTTITGARTPVWPPPILNGKQGNSIYSCQRMGIYFGPTGTLATKISEFWTYWNPSGAVCNSGI